MLLTCEHMVFFYQLLETRSNSLVFLISPSHSFLHVEWDSSFANGNFHIPIPFVLRQDPQPNTAQFSPGITFSLNSSHQISKHPQKVQKTCQIKRDSPQNYLRVAILLICVCRVRITWLRENHNKEMFLWSPPAFITSLLGSLLYKLWSNISSTSGPA